VALDPANFAARAGESPPGEHDRGIDRALATTHDQLR
jgi:hypothetical protein